MKKSLFYVGIALLVLFEIANVYFIMPMPFSQRARSIDIAYWLHSWRWLFRAVFGAMILAGVLPAWRAPGRRRLLAPISLVVVAVVAYAMNFQMSADHMFLAPASLVMQPAERNTVDMQAPRRRHRDRRRGARLSGAVHRLSPPGARHRRR